METNDLKQEFRELLNAAKWSQAEAARQLAMTPGAVSQITRENSPVKPSRGTLRLFHLLVHSASSGTHGVNSPGALVLREKWEVELISSLREVAPAARAPLLKAFGMLIAAHLPAQK